MQTCTQRTLDFVDLELTRDFLENLVVFFFFLQPLNAGYLCLPEEDERDGRYHHHTHAEDNHDYVLHVDACIKIQKNKCIRIFLLLLPLFQIPDFQILRLRSKEIKLDTNTLGCFFVEASFGAHLCILAHHPARNPHSRTGLAICQ